MRLHRPFSLSKNLKKRGAIAPHKGFGDEVPEK